MVISVVATVADGSTTVGLSEGVAAMVLAGVEGMTEDGTGRLDATLGADVEGVADMEGVVATVSGTAVMGCRGPVPSHQLPTRSATPAIATPGTRARTPRDERRIASTVAPASAARPSRKTVSHRGAVTAISSSQIAVMVRTSGRRPSHFTKTSP